MHFKNKFSLMVAQKASYWDSVRGDSFSATNGDVGNESDGDASSSPVSSFSALTCFFCDVTHIKDVKGGLLTRIGT